MNKTKIGLTTLILAAGVGETWASILTSLVLLGVSIYLLGGCHE